jgi:multidrug efflux pump subunit AcrA (membrane-fusion protein)
VTRRTGLWSAAGAVILVAALWCWLHARTPVVEHQTVTVARGSVVRLVTASGTVNPVTTIPVGARPLYFHDAHAG